MLFRHAKTETDSPSGQDVDRRLDDRGRHDSALMGAWLNSHPPHPDMVCVSTAVRTRQTWDLIAAAMPSVKPVVEHIEELYVAELPEILTVIRDAAVHDPRQLMLIGHNPGLHEMALGLIKDGDPAGRKALAGNLPTGSLVVIDFAIENWNDIAFRSGTLATFVSPKLLKESHQ